MDYIIFIILIFLFAAMVSLTAFNIVFANKNMSKTKRPRKQSENHVFLKIFFSRNTTSKDKFSQMQQIKERKKKKIIFTEENKAYWVDNNIFYVANVINGHPDFRTTEKVNTENMSKRELDKMLKILDNLRRGDKNERGSSGN